MVTSTSNWVKIKAKAVSNVNEELERLNKKFSLMKMRQYNGDASLIKDNNELNEDSESSVRSLDFT